LPSKSTKADAPEAPDRVLVGVIRRAHGVRGAVLVEVLSDNPGRFAEGSLLDATAPDGRSRRLRIESASPFAGGLRVAFEGVASRDEADALRGSRLEVERAAVPPPPAGSHYLFELVGCRAFDRAAGELGRVIDAIEDGGGWLLVVERPGGGRLLLPYVESFVRRVDPGAGRIEWALPEGLIEACASGS
jgi:16S rRNA processing protein RimM